MARIFYLFDCEKKVDIHIPTAETIIGRDSILQCDDKRISRQHGIIKLEPEQTDSIQITSTHTNPIFIRTEDNVLNILTKDLTATLRHGEKFALLPDQYWYEVRFRFDGEQETSVSSSVNGTLRVRTMEEVNSAVTTGEARVLPDWMGGTVEKRKNADESEAESSKKSKTEEVGSSEAAVAAVEVQENEQRVTAEDSPAQSSAEPSVIKPDPDASEASTSRPKSPKAEAPKDDVKKEAPDSTGPPPRPSCEFGIRCYRHAPEHRAQFAHPNDSDYRRPTFPAAPDDAPHCPFGVSCYRRNPQHFREYQHPDSSEYRASVAPVNRVPVNQQQQQQQPQRPQPDVGGDGRQRRRRTRPSMLARDIIMAAIANPRIFDVASSDEDEDNNEDLFDFETDSDEYRPDAESNDDDDDEGELEEIDTQELNDNGDEE